MMKWGSIEKLSAQEFFKLTGVRRNAFDKMIEALQEAHRLRKQRGGRPNKLSVEQMLLMALEYVSGEYTYLRVGARYGVSESYAYKIIRFVEDTLTQSKLW